MPFDKFFSSKPQKWSEKWQIKKKMQAIGKFTNPASGQFKRRTAKILCRDGWDGEWRCGEVVLWEDRDRRLQQLMDENPTLQFSWEVG